MKLLVDVTGMTHLLLGNCKKNNYNKNGLNYLI